MAKKRANRDEFPAPVVTALRNRAGNTCSRPECRASTSGPNSDPRKASNVGVAAHITAAAAGGPRYDVSMTPEERSDISNAIWLCQTCSKLIDSDPGRFTVDLLKKWKVEAEQTAQTELGTRRPSLGDVSQAISAVLSGLPSEISRHAISNVHKSAEDRLNSLDPRFGVKSSFNDGKACLEIYPRQDVLLTGRIRGVDAATLTDRMRALIERAEDFEMSGGSITFDESPLFNELRINEAVGSILIKAHSKQASVRIWTSDQASGKKDCFFELPATIAAGTKVAKLSAAGLDGLLSLSMEMSVTNTTPSVTASIKIDFSAWSGQDVRSLKHFRRINELIQSIKSKNPLHIELELDGINSASLSSQDAHNNEQFAEMALSLQHIENATTLLKYLSLPLPFPGHLHFTYEEYTKLKRAAEIASGKASNDKFNGASSDIIVDEGANNIRTLLSSDENLQITFYETEGNTIPVLGKNVEIPPAKVTIMDIRPVVNERIEDLKAGDTIKIHFAGKDTSKVQVLFEPRPVVLELPSSGEAATGLNRLT